MTETKESKQIRQMTNFIMQEAHEKCNEIRLKADHDYQLEIQNLVHAGKLRLQEKYAKKEKDLEIQQRVAKSNAVSASRVKKMKARDEMLNQLKAEALVKLSAFTKTPAYTTLLHGLLVQGLLKIQEQNVEIKCLDSDKAAVTKILPAALKEVFSKLRPGMSMPAASISSVALAPKTTAGGIVLVAYEGRIVVDQTLDERLSIAYTGVMPSVRKTLFPPSKASTSK
jgi:V-type H+-transporting ATPase subunit E